MITRAYARPSRKADKCCSAELTDWRGGRDDRCWKRAAVAISHGGGTRTRVLNNDLRPEAGDRYYFYSLGVFLSIESFDIFSLPAPMLMP